MFVLLFCLLTLARTRYRSTDRAALGGIDGADEFAQRSRTVIGIVAAVIVGALDVLTAGFQRGGLVTVEAGAGGVGSQTGFDLEEVRQGWTLGQRGEVRITNGAETVGFNVVGVALVSWSGSC